MKKFWYIIIIVVAGVLGYGLWNGYRNPAPSQGQGKYDSFAQCLAEKGVTMYGAAWCPHCQNQKKLFGSSFQYVPYVECPQEPKICLEKNITGYPTWIFADETRLEGERGFQELSQSSGCELPI